MTKMHFQKLADALKAAQPPLNDVTSFIQWQADVYAVAGVCADANDRFNEARFLKACGLIQGGQ